MTDMDGPGYIPFSGVAPRTIPIPDVTQEAQKVTGERVQFNLNMLQDTTFSDMLKQQLHQQRASLEERCLEDIAARDKLIEQIADVTKAIRSIDRALDELNTTPAEYDHTDPTE
jgi:hypothetical protein